MIEVESSLVGITRVRLAARGRAREVGEGAAFESASRARREIQSYLEGQLREFTVPVELEGTPFQRAVWNELLRIPYGGTRTYGQIAVALGKPRAARAVGTACGANPVPLIVPCHRVIGGNGSLVGFGGGVAVKQQLLALEAGARA
jgi:methylated-DNA-[protein]-cysteine S-methyltransferase